MTARATARRSNPIRDQWQQVICRLPIRERIRWLCRKDVEQALGLAEVRQLCKQVDGARKAMLQHACSGAWIRDAESMPGGDPRGRPPAPVTGKSERDLLAFEACVRQSGRDPQGVHLTRRVPNANSRLALSWAQTTVIARPAGQEHDRHYIGHRWTPEIAVMVEDQLDLMTAEDAMHYEHPASPSAVVFERGRFRGARESETMLICGECGFGRRVTERQRRSLEAAPACPDCGVELLDETTAMGRGIDGASAGDDSAE